MSGALRRQYQPFAALDPLAKFMETLLRDGDEETRDAVAISLLEGVHDSIERVPQLAATLVPLLGPLGRLAWENVVRNNGYFRSDQFKAERSALPEDARRKTNGDP